jgi:hypothetical protein
MSSVYHSEGGAPHVVVGRISHDAPPPIVAKLTSHPLHIILPTPLHHETGLQQPSRPCVSRLHHFWLETCGRNGEIDAFTLVKG